MARGPLAVAIAYFDRLVAAAIEQNAHLLLAQLAHGYVERDVEVLGRGLQQLPVVARLVFRRPAGDGPVGQRQLLIGHNEVGIDLLLDAQPLALRASAVRGVEAEGARLDGRNARAVIGAVEVFGVEVVGRVSGCLLYTSRCV